MFKISIFLLLSLFLTVLGKKYSCDLSYYGDACTVSGLALTRNNSKFEIETKYPWDVKTITLKGVVPVLTRGICEALPNLETINANDLSVEEIEDYAFWKCKKLKTLSLERNNFKKLHKKSFYGLYALSSLTMSGGNVPELTGEFRHLTRLRELHLNDMNITKVDPIAFRDLKNIETLSFYGNNLFDFDFKTIHNFVPALRNINLNGNYFTCARVKSIFAKIKQNFDRNEVNCFSEETQNEFKLEMGYEISTEVAEVEDLKSSFNAYNADEKKIDALIEIMNSYDKKLTQLIQTVENKFGKVLSLFGTELELEEN